MLAPVKDNDHAKPYYQLSLIKLGRAVELQGQKLQMMGQDLSGLSFSDVDISGSDFSNSFGSEVSFKNVKLNNAVLKNGSFSGLKIEGVSALNSDFSGVDLNGKMQGSIFTGASFNRAKLRLYDVNDLDFTKVNFSNATLFIRRFSKGTFNQANFSNADISGTDFSSADLEGAYWTGVQYDCETKFPQSFRIDGNLLHTAAKSCKVSPQKK